MLLEEQLSNELVRWYFCYRLNWQKVVDQLYTSDGYGCRQEVARILDDQSRVANDALRQAEAKAKARDKKLEIALSDLAAKDELVKKHIKVAEEAMIGNKFLFFSFACLFSTTTMGCQIST